MQIYYIRHHTISIDRTALHHSVAHGVRHGTSLSSSLHPHIEKLRNQCLSCQNLAQSENALF